MFVRAIRPPNGRAVRRRARCRPRPPVGTSRALGRNPGRRRGRARTSPPSCASPRRCRPPRLFGTSGALGRGRVRWFFIIGLTRLVLGNPLLPRPGGGSGLPGPAGTGWSVEPVSGVVRSGQTDALPFCRALRPGFAGVGFLGFLVAKQPLPKRGRRLGPGGRPGPMMMPPPRLRRLGGSSCVGSSYC